MINKISCLALAIVCFWSCVPQKKFLTQQESFKNSTDSLKAIVQSLEFEKDTFLLALSYERGANNALFITQEKLQDRLDVLQLEIDQLGSNASSTEQSLFADIQKREKEIVALQSQIEGVQNVLEYNQERLGELAEKVQHHLSEITSDSVETRQRAGQLVIVLGENALFRKSSTSSFIEEGKDLLYKIAQSIQQYPEMQIQVVGHTDNRDIDRKNLDNWQYSALRAVSIVKYLSEEANLGANRILAASKSEYSPLESNESADGRARNRRIELIIAPPAGFLEQKILKLVEIP